MDRLARPARWWSALLGAGLLVAACSASESALDDGATAGAATTPPAGEATAPGTTTPEPASTTPDAPTTALADTTTSATTTPTTAVAPTTSAAGTTQATIVNALVAQGVPLLVTDPVAGLALLAAKGYAPLHGWVTVAGQGWVLARPGDGTLSLTAPDILAYRPVRGGTTAGLSDQVPDAPYELVGVGWSAPYPGSASVYSDPTEAPPSLAPLPAGPYPDGAWFRRAAACDMGTGDMVAFTVNFPAPGTPDREAAGNLVCRGVGVGSTWLALGAVTEGAPGVCALAPDDDHRPVVAGSGVHLRAADPGVDRPGAGGRVGGPAGPDLQAYEDAVVAASTAACQTVADVRDPAAAPTLWRAMRWEAHAFFHADGTTVAGIEDRSLVPAGMALPAEAYPPGASILVLVP